MIIRELKGIQIFFGTPTKDPLQFFRKQETILIVIF